MKRTDVENGILDLIKNSQLASDLGRATIDFYDDSKINEQYQLMVARPAILVYSGDQDFESEDIYGYTYLQDLRVQLLVCVENYRGAKERRQGDGVALGANDVLDGLKDALRGQNPIATASTGARIFLLNEVAVPEVGPGVTFVMNLKVTDFMQPAGV